MSSVASMMTQHEAAVANQLARLALDEDLGGMPGLDLTAVATGGRQVAGAIVARVDGVVAGIEVAREVFRQRGVDEFDVLVRDGERFEPGDMIASVAGDAAAVLSAERVALNFLQRLSGVATLTRAYVRAVAGTGARICDTRKTTPGMRALERHAVRCGGGTNHRFGLFDVAMVKDNHVDVAGLAKSVDIVRAQHPHIDVIIEVRTLHELRAALAEQPEVVLLDNMDIDTMAAAVNEVGGVVRLEASGGITLQNVAGVASTGVDRISVGALTHSAPALDLALDVRPT